MTDVPIISIDEIEDVSNDEDSIAKPNINECHTDIEELDSDHDGKKRFSANSLIPVLKEGEKCNGAVTDIEDFEDSDDNEPENEPDYGPEVSLAQFLDDGVVDEHSNLQGNVNKQKLQAMRSVQKTPSPTAFHLTINNPDVGGGVTDLEDMEGSCDEAEDEKVYSDDDKAIVLEDSNCVDVHDSMNRKKAESSIKLTPKVIEPSSSSSECEKEKPKSKPKSQKHFLKRVGQRCDEAKSDVENIYFSDDERRRSMPKTIPVLETPEIEIMRFEGSDNEEIDNDKQFPEINITFMASRCDVKQNKKKYKSTPAPSPMLNLPENFDEATTDVENLNSSDDDDEEEENQIKIRPKSLMPLAVAKSDALTDVEDFDDDDGDEEEEKSPEIEIDLPSAVREFTVLIESKTGEPYKQTTPLPDSILLGFDDLDADKGLTDVEDFSDDSGNDEEDDDDLKYRDNFKIPDMDGGVIESSDHAVSHDSKMRISNTPEPKTDTEDIYVKRQEKSSDCRRRRTKNKSSCNKAIKSNFLDTRCYVDEEAGSALTDVEDLNVEDDDVILKDKNVKQRRATIECSPRKLSNGDAKTDIEYFSDGEDVTVDLTSHTPDLVQSINAQIETCIMTMSRETSGKKKNIKMSHSHSNINVPLIRKNLATPRGSIATAGTDIESFQCDSDNDEHVSYSRAQTATPTEVTRVLADLCTSEVQHVNRQGFDRAREQLEVKGYCEVVEAHTDIEDLD